VVHEKIEIMLGDWLYNAGIVGFINILKSAGETIQYNKNSFEFSVEALDNFEEKFFNYLINTYEKNLSWYKITSAKGFVEKHLANDLEEFSDSDLENLNKMIGSKGTSGSIKYYLNSKSYEKAYDLIEGSRELVDLETRLVPIKKGGKDDVKEILLILQNIINLLEKETFKKYIAGKNVIYTIIRQGWTGVSILNPQTKELNMYSDYKKSFVTDVSTYLESPKEKYKYNCFTCNRSIKNLNETLSFLNEVGFDVVRKPSHIWDYSNDVGICPICRLIYSCVPCGMTYVINSGIFINRNYSVEMLVDINQHMKHEILDVNSEHRKSTYRAMIMALTNMKNDNSKYDLSDIQVIRYEDIGGANKYRFNVLSKKVLKVISDSTDDLNHLMRASFKEADTYYRLYDEVLKILLNNGRFFLTVNKLLSLKLQNKRDLYYSSHHIMALLRINQRMIKGDEKMENEKEMLKKYNASGYYLKQAYLEKKSENKLGGISYKLLNALKTNNTSMFMDTLLNCYLYVNKQVPTFIIDCMQDEDMFKSIGYAFVTGLVNGETYEKSENGGK
jgi:CRISPR-associated protein Cst1